MSPTSQNTRRFSYPVFRTFRHEDGQWTHGPPGRLYVSSTRSFLCRFYCFVTRLYCLLSVLTLGRGTRGQLDTKGTRGRATITIRIRFHFLGNKGSVFIIVVFGLALQDCKGVCGRLEVGHRCFYGQARDYATFGSYFGGLGNERFAISDNNMVGGGGVATLLTTSVVTLLRRSFGGVSISGHNFYTFGVVFLTRFGGTRITRGNGGHHIFNGLTVLLRLYNTSYSSFVTIRRVTIFIGNGRAVHVAIGHGTRVGLVHLGGNRWLFKIN